MAIFYPLMLIAVYMIIRGVVYEPRHLLLRHHQIPVVDLPPELEGTRLLHLTDLHLRAERRYEEKMLTLVSEAKPDLVLLTGDYVDHPSRLYSLGEVAAVLAARHRVIAVLGDNDLEEPAVIQCVLEEAGITVLRNESESVCCRGQELHVAGIDDPRFPSSDLQRALSKVPPAPRVLLSHSAEIWPQAAAAGVDLLLCGHTHGGQVCVPYWGALYTNDRLGRHYAAGIIRKDGMYIHVSTGVGYAKMRLRLFCPPEIACLTLSRSPVPGKTAGHTPHRSP